MLLSLYAVYDSASKVYDRPWCARSDGEALRAFGDIANDVNHPIGKHPEHYKLFKIGSFDDNSGIVDSDVPVHMMNAHEAVTAHQRPDSGNGVSVENLSLDNDGYPLSPGGTD